MTENTQVAEAPKPTTTVEGFIFSLGNVISNLRTRYRLTENGAIKTIQVALEYDLNRRNFPQPEPTPEEVTVGSA